MFNWNEIYSMPYNASIDTTIQSFQYKLINRIIPTNKFLFKCKLVSSTLCDLCLSNEETITHMFWECPIIQDIWNNLNSFFQNNGITIELNLINVLFGISTNIHYKSINYIIMLMKYYIFGSKYRKEVPNFNGFHHYLQNRITIEREIATTKNKLNQHLQKWAFLTP